MTRQVTCGLVFAVAVAIAGCGKATDDSEFLRADLAGANEVPARPTGASGVAAFQVDGTTVYYTLQVDGLAAITASHIHNGAAGVNGPVVVDLAGATTSAGEDRIFVEGTFDASSVRGITYDQLLAAMRAGSAYVNVHTTRFPGGEVRGQLRVLPKD